MSNNLTVAILTLNEVADIRQCIESVTCAGELLLLDSGSIDGTIARARSARTAIPLRVQKHPFANYSSQRNVALGLLRTPWVLFLDADERLTPALEVEIGEILRIPRADAYWIPRRNIILGRWMRYAGWYPDAQLRLLRRACATYDETRPVHEVADVNGAVGHIHNSMIHYNYRSMREFVHKQRAYARYEAQQLSIAGGPRRRAIVGQPMREFWRRYVGLRGYRDGWRGLFLSMLLAYYRMHAVRSARLKHASA